MFPLRECCDLKIVNGRIGKDKYGEYTCQTKKGQSTIDYVIISMELFHKTIDLYIDNFDTCISVVHCHICIFFSCKDAVITKYNDFDNVVCDRSKYAIENNVLCKWDAQLREQYTMEFNVDEINTLQHEFKNLLQGIDHVTQHIVDSLYINI